MDIFNVSSYTELWTIPIPKRTTNSNEEELIITSMANHVYSLNEDFIKSMIYKITNFEFKKHTDLRKRILLREQIYKNIINNIYTSLFNMAKTTYDNHKLAQSYQQSYQQNQDPNVNASISSYFLSC